MIRAPKDHGPAGKYTLLQPKPIKTAAIFDSDSE